MATAANMQNAAQNEYIEVPKSATLLMNEQSYALEQAGKEIYKFGFGQSPFSPPEPVVESLIQHAAEHRYTAVQGLPELREAIASFHNTKQNLSIKPENILIAPGSKMLIYAVQASFRELDVLIPAPAWVSYEPQADLLNHTSIRVMTSFEERWRVNPENLQKALAQKANPNTPSLLIINYPGNPDGLDYSDEELKALADVLRAHNVWVVADEIYSFVTHNGEFKTLAHHYPERTIITTGLSKWGGAGGWRLGAALLPDGADQLKDTMLGIASETYSCASINIQMAAITAYSGSEEIDAYVEAEQKILGAVGSYCQNVLSEAGANVVPPAGGFYIYVDFSPIKVGLEAKGITNVDDMCSAILKDANVALLPSTAFGFTSDHLSTRLAFIDFDGDKARHALRDNPSLAADEAFVEEYAAKTVKGIIKLADWIKSYS